MKKVNLLPCIFSKIKILDSEGDFKHLLENSSKILASSSIVTIIQFAEMIVLARFLMTDGYGLYSALLVFVALINQFFDVRISETTIKFGSAYWEKRDKVRLASLIKLSYFIDLISGVLAFIVVIITAKWAADKFLHNFELKNLIQLYALTLLISTLDHTSNAVLRIADRFLVISVYATLMAILRFLIILIFLLFKGGIFGVLIGLLIVDFISALVSLRLSWQVLKKEIGKNILFKVPIKTLKKEYKEIARMIMSTNFMAYIRMIMTKVDVLILAYYGSPSEVGLYKVAVQLSNSVLRLSDPLFVSVLPDFSRLISMKQFNRFSSLIKKSTWLMAIVLIPSATIVVIWRTDFLILLFGPKFAYAQNIILIMIWGFVVSGILFWVWPALLSLGRPELGVIVSTLGAILYTFILYLVVPRSGAIGIAYTFSIIQIVSHFILVLSIRVLIQRCKKMEI